MCRHPSIDQTFESSALAQWLDLYLDNVIRREVFGEGLNWAGCTMVTLLGQQRRFETFDFCYHLLRVNRHDAKHEVVKGIGVRSYTSRLMSHISFLTGTLAHDGAHTSLPDAQHADLRLPEQTY